MKNVPVCAGLKQVLIPTYNLGLPEKNPLFFEKRVYQGSNGKVYPLPFIDKVYDKPEPREYKVAYLENGYVKLEMLPEIGGRIFKGQDKTNDNYDFFYRQDVIKPALVGLAGPWISGGVEFNWPQHHRPGTYMPADVFIEEEADGARTVWMSELDPLTRMKGMHGVRLRPGSSLIELRVRLYNRTPLTQSFLWWANVAARVHDNYQSFFPPDVHYVADHAVRAMSSFPVARNDYYGVDYAARAGANDLTWYRNIPVPTSYMVCETQGSFFGGYDYDKQGGFVHVADRHLSPGKKQWTWGNHEFGWAWDRELTDDGGPYVELMAGVFTDNQPDFSYLLPDETRAFSQFWWPIQKTGPVQEANQEVALRLVVREDRKIDAGVLVSSRREDLRIVLTDADQVLCECRVDLEPGKPWIGSRLFFSGENESSLCLQVFGKNGDLLGEYRQREAKTLVRNREVAVEPADPETIKSVDELFLVAEHLELYRHPTRDPESYWREGLKRDGNDYRCNLAMGKMALKRGDFETARTWLEMARSRLTEFHPNPSTGECHYFSGICHRFLGNPDSAYAFLHKAVWNFEWRSAAYYELACIDALRGCDEKALEHALSSQKTNTDNNKAKVLQAILLKRLDRANDAQAVLEALLEDDPLDSWAACELARQTGSDFDDFLDRFRNDAQTMLDVAFDYAHAGMYKAAIDVLELHLSNPVRPSATPNPLEHSQSVLFSLAWLHGKLDNDAESRIRLEQAGRQSSDYFFPSRLEEQLILEWAVSHGTSWLPLYGLGNYYYDKRRHYEAITAWEKAAMSANPCSVVYRNLGIGYWNTRREGQAAREAYLKAIGLNPADPRLVFEYDQLRRKLGDPPEQRLSWLEENRRLVEERDDCCVELADLFNQSGRFGDALTLLRDRRFHPWEGGEGKVLRQYTLAMLGLGIKELDAGNPETALGHFAGALDTPENLGEAYHLHQTRADVNYWMGIALAKLDRAEEAEAAFQRSATEPGDFQDSSVVEFSESSYYSGLSLIELGQFHEARELFIGMIEHASAMVADNPRIPFFATSLPNLLVFDEDLKQVEVERRARLRELAERGLRNLTEAMKTD